MRIAMLLGSASLLILGAGCTSRGAISMSPVKLGDAVIAVAIDVSAEGVETGAVMLTANSAAIATDKGAATSTCFELGGQSTGTYHVVPAGASFDANVRLHAVLREGTCLSGGAYLADAVYPLNLADTAGGSTTATSSTGASSSSASSGSAGGASSGSATATSSTGGSSSSTSSGSAGGASSSSGSTSGVGSSSSTGP